MEEEKAILTKHSIKQLRERMGLNKRACQKQAQTALDQGLRHSDLKGKVKRYIDKLFLEHRRANNIRIYGEFIYLFRFNTLITVLNLPNDFRGLHE